MNNKPQNIKHKNTLINLLLSKASGYIKTDYGYIININMKKDIANAVLGGNIKNRKVNKSNVARFASDMSSGKWEPSNDMLIIDRNGILRNGQHRTMAFILAGCPDGICFTFALLTECNDQETEEICRTLDTGKGRSYSDDMVINGLCAESLSHKFESLARKISYYTTGYTRYPKFTYSDYNQIVAMYRKEFETIAPLMGRSLVADMAAAACIVMRITNDNDKIPTMIKMAEAAIGLTEGSPDLILNKIMQTRSVDAAKKKMGHNSLTFAGAGNCFVAKIKGQEMCSKSYSLAKFIKWIETTAKTKNVDVLPKCIWNTFEYYKKSQSKTK